MQENGYYKQPYEVEKVEEIVRVYQWVKKRPKKKKRINMSLDEIKTLKKIHDKKLFEYEYNLNNILRNKFGKSNVSADLNYNHRTGHDELEKETLNKFEEFIQFTDKVYDQLSDFQAIAIEASERC